MLIVNGNHPTSRYITINLDYIYQIFVFQENSGGYSVCLGICAGKSVTYFNIVTYKTEKRAEKEIDNILEAYANNERVYFIKEENE